MIKSITIAVWACAVMAAAAFGAIQSGLTAPDNNHEASRASKDSKLESVKTKQISVPILNAGKVEGYVVVRLAAIVSAAAAKSHSVKIEDILTNEAFIAFQTFSVDVFLNGKEPDLQKVTAQIAQRTSEKLPPGSVQSVLIHEIAFVDKKDARR